MGCLRELVEDAADHPVSKAIAEGRALQGDSVTAFKALAGRGVKGVVEGRSQEAVRTAPTL